MKPTFSISCGCEAEEFITHKIKDHFMENPSPEYESKCTGCGTHPSFWKTVVESKEWSEWEKIANKEGFDCDESREIGAFSPEHFSAFLDFIRNQTLEEVIRVVSEEEVSNGGMYNSGIKDSIRAIRSLKK